MKKIAIVVDFDPKIKKSLSSSHYDVFILDRYHQNIGTIKISEDNEFHDVFSEEMTIDTFYKAISAHYKSIFCVFISYQYSDIEDHLLTKNINQNKLSYEAKMFTYLLDYKNHNKEMIMEQILEMVNQEYEIKEIIIRIHQIRKRESFSLFDIFKRSISGLS